MPPPQINSIPASGDETSIVHDKSVTGLRFLGERFTIDAAIFQRLIAEEVQGRYLPTALDIPATMGSSEAVAILGSEGVMATYPDYAEKLQEAQDYFLDTTGNTATSATTDVWTSNLYWSWLYMLQPLVDDNNQEGLPSFMTTQAWTRKELNTFEGSWTELKHDTGAYSKPPKGYYGAGAPQESPPDDRGYVEPNPVLFGRLASLCQMTIDGLEERDMLSEETRTGLEKLRYVAETCTVISEKELTSGTITDAEYEFIRNIGDELFDIWKTARQEELQDTSTLDYLGAHPCGIVTDVATDARSGQVLEEATGFAASIYVVFPRDNELAIGRGMVYTQYEFEVDAGARMTDEQWHEWIKDSRYPLPTSLPLPEFAEWKTSYMADISD
jgi:hypothetical protein